MNHVNSIFLGAMLCFLTILANRIPALVRDDEVRRLVARAGYDDQFGEIMDHLIRLEEKLDAIVFPNPRNQNAN